MIAIDTNVLIYARDKADPRRQKIAIDLITSVPDGILLWQVACEFLSASRPGLIADVRESAGISHVLDMNQ